MRCVRGGENHGQRSQPSDWRRRGCQKETIILCKVESFLGVQSNFVAELTEGDIRLVGELRRELRVAIRL